MIKKQAVVGDIIELSSQKVEVFRCEKCSRLMVNIDADELKPGDLTILKQAGVVISNPETDKLICVNCEYETIGAKLASWFESDDDDDDDDSFFSSGSFSGGSSFGGFGGFGGGGFGGGGVSRGF